MNVEELIERLKREDPKMVVADLEGREIEHVTSTMDVRYFGGQTDIRSRRVLKLTPWRIEPRVG